MTWWVIQFRKWRRAVSQGGHHISHLGTCDGEHSLWGVPEAISSGWGCLACGTSKWRCSDGCWLKLGETQLTQYNVINLQWCVHFTFMNFCCCLQRADCILVIILPKINWIRIYLQIWSTVRLWLFPLDFSHLSSYLVFYHL